MKAIVKAKINDITSYDKIDYEVECEVKKDCGKLILDFSNTTKHVPYPFLRTGEFTIKLEPTEEEIGCCGDCNTCLTPIC